ncbi:hypothetical protein MESS2_980020 [Mesorhizobium metallidurans STM 2683]|uniref:Uncharacterized protein n=1 Tax=Mesorhizobium metallidurans STM 2683 TaxID=1297569 RepID=M5EZ07_9HYPH|nr:hypothetical protein MESS2_980020 [Mesorhizobium metallidurans STM 2683]
MRRRRLGKQLTQHPRQLELDGLAPHDPALGEEVSHEPAGRQSHARASRGVTSSSSRAPKCCCSTRRGPILPSAIQRTSSLS